MKPIIGVILRPNQNIDNQPVWTLYRPISQAIYAASGIPIGLLNPEQKVDSNEITQLLNNCDGLLLQGGRTFDWFDFLILEEAMKRNLPILGICLGMQTMAVFKNGKLQRVLGHHLENQTHLVHIAPHTKLFEIFKTNLISVNSRHYEQVVKTDCTVSAQDQKGVIEAIELSDYPFFIGVEWHPEDMISYDKNMRTLFEVFVQACRRDV